MWKNITSVPGTYRQWYFRVGDEFLWSLWGVTWSIPHGPKGSASHGPNDSSWQGSPSTKASLNKDEKEIVKAGMIRNKALERKGNFRGWEYSCSKTQLWNSPIRFCWLCFSGGNDCRAASLGSMIGMALCNRLHTLVQCWDPGAVSSLVVWCSRNGSPTA